MAKRLIGALPIKSISAKKIHGAFPKATLMRFNPGEEIFAENTTGHTLFYILSGHVQIYRKLRNGHKLFLATLKKGDFVGEMALLMGGRRSANAKAETTVKLLQINARDLTAMIQRGDKLAGEIALYTSALLAFRMQNLLHLFVEEAERRPKRTARKPSLVIPDLLKQMYANCAV
jgi:CRP-like cAMP-binding protein